MGIILKIHNVKNIDDFEFVIPTERGLYALTGENGSGKTTVVACAATAFYNPAYEEFFGSPRTGAYISFEYEGKRKEICESGGKWITSSQSRNLGITGFYEGSIGFGNRFKDIDSSLLGSLARIGRDQLNHASSFVKKSLGSILHDDETFYDNLFVLKKTVREEMKLKRFHYFYENKGSLISQLNMSTGENLLLTILSSIESRMKKEVYGGAPAFLFLDEIELALHSSALRRLVFFLKEIAMNLNTVVLFSTHSIELIRSITPDSIFYIQRHVNGSMEIINPCFPVYATRNLESSNYGHDFIILVEDDLARGIIERILKERKLLSNKRILVIAVGGWTQVLRFANDTIRSNLAICTTKILIVLDRDIQKEVFPFMKKEHINISLPLHYLPVKSLEKYLLNKLYVDVDTSLFRELNDYLFQGKSLDIIIGGYDTDVKKGVINDESRIKNGKVLYDILRNELQQIRKTDQDLIEIIINYLFNTANTEIQELSSFLEKQLCDTKPVKR